LSVRVSLGEMEKTQPPDTGWGKHPEKEELLGLWGFLEELPRKGSRTGRNGKKRTERENTGLVG